MIVLAIIWNFYYYKGIESEKVQEFELILMFQPLITILLAEIFLKNETNLKVAILALVAAIALIFSQARKHHFDLTPGAKSMYLAVLFMSIELIIIRLVLDFMSPIALYTVRTGIIFLFFYIYYKPKMFRVSRVNIYHIFITAVLGTVQMVTKFYGFEIYGVVYMSLILILSPMLVYMSSIFYFHEKLRVRTAISALVILFCIVYATISVK